MKFSIKFLLALLVLGALLANYFIVQQSNKKILAEEAEVLAESERLVFRQREAAEFSDMYRMALDSEELLNTKYQTALDASINLPYIVSELAIEDAGKISYVNLPLLNEGSLHHLAFRIHVPKSFPVFLASNFENGESCFVSPKNHSVQLSPGQHIVDYRFDKDDKKTLELFIDKEMIFSIPTKPLKAGFSYQDTPTDQRNLKDLKKPKRILKLEPEPESSVPNSQPPRMIVLLRGGESAN